MTIRELINKLLEAKDLDAKVMVQLDVEGGYWSLHEPIIHLDRQINSDAIILMGSEIRREETLAETCNHGIVLAGQCLHCGATVGPKDPPSPLRKYRK